MRSKAPLVMMEQIVMVLVFALAAALCLQTFVLSGKISRQTEAVSRGTAEAQNAAETIKALGPERYIEEQNYIQTEHGYRLGYDETWNRVFETEQAAYFMDTELEEEEELS